MIGFILITHNKIGSEILRTIQDIIQNKPEIQLVEMTTTSSLEDTQAKIHLAMQSLKKAEGVLIITDIFGATPSNLCQAFLMHDKVEIISGCNLPMLLKVATGTFTGTLPETSEFLSNYAKESIRVFSKP